MKGKFLDLFVDWWLEESLSIRTCHCSSTGRGEDNPKATAPANGKQGHDNPAFSDEGPAELEKKEMVETETRPNADAESSLHQDPEAKETTLL